MFKLYLNFLRGITTNWIVALGVALTTASFLLFIVFLKFFPVIAISEIKELVIHERAHAAEETH